MRIIESTFIDGQVFGDTVELASLMESSGSAMKIQITSATKVECYSESFSYQACCCLGYLGGGG